MADLFIIGDAVFTDDHWVIVTMPSYRRTHRLKPYNLANGNPRSVHLGRELTQRSMTVRYVPSQNFRTGRIWDRTSWPAGANWYSELHRLELAGADGSPQAFTIGDIDYGEWRVEVRSNPEADANLKNPREGTMAALVTTVEITLTEVDERRTRLTNNAPGVSG